MDIAQLTFVLYGLSFIFIVPVLLYYIAFKGSSFAKFVQSAALFVLFSIVFYGVGIDVFGSLNTSGSFIDIPLYSCEPGFYIQGNECVLEDRGAGTVEDPYIMYDVDDLEYMREHPNLHYVLKNDIRVYGRSFSPISEFTGTLDGNGNTIYISQIGSAVNINGDYYAGFIAINKGVITNIVIDTTIEYNRYVNTDSQLYVGTLVAYNKGTITEVDVESNIMIMTNCESYIGGVIGYNETKVGAIVHEITSYNRISLEIENVIFMGGNIGYSVTETQFLTASGDMMINGTNDVFLGGNIGYVEASTNHLTFSGIVDATSNEVSVGGNIGKVDAGSYTTVEYLYADGYVGGNDAVITYLGGNIGDADTALLSKLEFYGSIGTSMATGSVGGNVGLSNGTISKACNNADIYINVFDNVNLEKVEAHLGGIVGNGDSVDNSCFKGLLNITNHSLQTIYAGGISGETDVIKDSIAWGIIDVTGSSDDSYIAGITGISNQLVDNSIAASIIRGYSIDDRYIARIAYIRNEVSDSYVISDTEFEVNNLSGVTKLEESSLFTYIDLDELHSTEFHVKLEWDEEIWNLNSYTIY